MLELEQQAKEAGITVMNEIGVIYEPCTLSLNHKRTNIISLILGWTICMPFPQLKVPIKQEERSYRSCHTVEVSQLQKV